jgi:hypothetical protein
MPEFVLPLHGGFFEMALPGVSQENALTPG